MELNSFREILLKKAEESDNSNLQTLIKYTKDEILVAKILESLEKMAQPSAAMGRGANSAITSMAGSLTNTDVAQMRDALSHHISHYKSALKNGNRDVADQHLGKIVPLMHTIGRAAKHSNGKLGLDYRSTTPWESNYTTLDRHPHNGKLKEGTKDLGRRPKPTRETTTRGVPNYRYLEMAPHAGHADSKHLPLPSSGYPFEETQVGSQEDIDAGKAWLPIEDVGPQKEFIPHPFDSHPIHGHADLSEDKRTDAHRSQFANDLAAWKSSDAHKQWLADQKAKYTKDPEAYKARGTQKPGHFWDGMKLSEQPEHARPKTSAQSSQQVQANQGEAVSPQVTPQEQAATTVAPTAAAKQQMNPKDEKVALSDIRSKFSPEDIAKMPPSMKKILGFED